MEEFLEATADPKPAVLDVQSKFKFLVKNMGREQI